MKICSLCGSAVKDDEAFCSNCGKAMETAPVQQEPSAQPQATQQEPAPQPLFDAAPQPSEPSGTEQQPPQGSYTNQPPPVYTQYAPQQPYQQPGYPPYPPQGYAPYAMDETVRVGEWVINMLLCAIPIVNIVMLCIWAFGSTAKPSLRNWARATLIFLAVALAFWVLILIVAVAFSSSMYYY